MTVKRPKLSGRTKVAAKGPVEDFRLRILEAVSDGLIILEGTRRYPRVSAGQGAEGLRRVFKEEEARRAAECLRKQRLRGFIEIKKFGDRLSMTLTEKGETMLLKLRLRAAPKRTDGKIIVVIFDIPERVARVRRIVRQFLKSAGFTRLQDSVWISDRECEAEMSSLLKWMDATEWVRCLLSEEILETT